MKGIPAESGVLHPPLGLADNIRMTVAFAESYVLIVCIHGVFTSWSEHGLSGAYANCISFVFIITTAK